MRIQKKVKDKYYIVREQSGHALADLEVLVHVAFRSETDEDILCGDRDLGEIAHNERILKSHQYHNLFGQRIQFTNENINCFTVARHLFEEFRVSL